MLCSSMSCAARLTLFPGRNVRTFDVITSLACMRFSFLADRNSVSDAAPSGTRHRCNRLDLNILGRTGLSCKPLPAVDAAGPCGPRRHGSRRTPVSSAPLSKPDLS
jgi:hypothetical protein